MFKKVAKSALLMALPGVIISIGMTAAMCYPIFPVMGAETYGAWVTWVRRGGGEEGAVNTTT